MSRGKRIPTETKKAIREDYNNGVSTKDIAMKYGIAYSTAARISNQRLETAESHIEAISQRKQMLEQSIKQKQAEFDALRATYAEFMQQIRSIIGGSNDSVNS